MLAFMGVKTQGGSVYWWNQPTIGVLSRTCTGVLHTILDHDRNLFLVIDTTFPARPFP